MNRDLINKVKYSHFLYNCYYYIGSLAVRLLGRFIKQDKKTIVFSSFGGRKYDDSPRCIYEAMMNDKRFRGYRFVWAFVNPEKFEVKNTEKVKCDTLSYYKVLMSAKVWVTNSTMERGLSFKPERIFNLNTWHGTPIKLLGSDISKENKSFGAKGEKNHNDIMLAQGHYDVDIFSRAFGVPRENLRITGLPRNDELVCENTEENRERIRKLLGVSNNKKVILYAPTFREYDMDSTGNCTLSLPVDLKKWEQILGNDYVLLMRAHYEVVKHLQINSNSFVKEVSSYPNLNELMIVSDLLVSDYSSIFFDYAIQGKPMLCFAYDYERYVRERGLYFDIRKELKCNIDNEDDLLTVIKMMDVKERQEISRIFRDKYIEAYGDASVQCLDIIYNSLQL